jgi:hypothetical protein
MGALPEPGGLMDQEAPFVEALVVALSDRAAERLRQTEQMSDTLRRAGRARH